MHSRFYTVTIDGMKAQMDDAARDLCKLSKKPQMTRTPDDIRHMEDLIKEIAMLHTRIEHKLFDDKQLPLF